MNRKNVFLSLLTLGFLLSSFVIERNNTESDLLLTDAEMQCASGQGCVEDCALAVTYCGLSVVKWWYVPLCGIYTSKCVNCGGDPGGGCTPTVGPEDVCDGQTTTAGEYECDYYGGQVINYNNGCQGASICCIEDYY
ncbi:MAG TPA: hypothetical protein DCE41_27795 [Cytophagales bacterium]|nr:hypothetical protein [Cytophagales bacterium]HAA22751.1 hypothetical protein [Cytophagales bacterium]HAP63843.1 hypothetical protein [Cytophagales bacterium]